MLIAPGRCCKCPCRICSGTTVGPKYEEIVLIASDSSRVHVGICNECEFCEEDVAEVESALKESFRHAGFEWKAKLIGLEKRSTLQEVLKEVQSSKCMKCGEKLGVEWCVSNGVAMHLICDDEKFVSRETIPGTERKMKRRETRHEKHERLQRQRGGAAPV